MSPSESKARTRYYFKGNVRRFSNVALRDWTCTTMAVSEKQARVNFMFQSKKRLGLSKDAAVTLSGIISTSPIP